MEQETAIFILNDLLIWIELYSQVKRGGERCPVRYRVTQLIFNPNSFILKQTGFVTLTEGRHHPNLFSTVFQLVFLKKASM